MANEQSQNGRGGIKSMRSHTQKAIHVNASMYAQGKMWEG